jgi:hypothetical protein
MQAVLGKLTLEVAVAVQVAQVERRAAVQELPCHLLVVTQLVAPMLVELRRA